jgi:hypothetical protein
MRYFVGACFYYIGKEAKNAVFGSTSPTETWRHNALERAKNDSIVSIWSLVHAQYSFLSVWHPLRLKGHAAAFVQSPNRAEGSYVTMNRDDSFSLTGF